eukprot:4503584-Alexandrium_andersonii.AAC.1
MAHQTRQDAHVQRGRQVQLLLQLSLQGAEDARHLIAHLFPASHRRRRPGHDGAKENVRRRHGLDLLGPVPDAGLVVRLQHEAR